MKYKFSFGEVDDEEILNNKSSINGPMAIIKVIASDKDAITKTIAALIKLDTLKAFSILSEVRDSRKDAEFVSELGYAVKLFNIPNSDDIEIHVQYCIPYSLKIIGRITPHDFTIITKIVLNSIYGKRG